jgi:hypothetical protein
VYFAVRFSRLWLCKKPAQSANRPIPRCHLAVPGFVIGAFVIGLVPVFPTAARAQDTCQRLREVEQWKLSFEVEENARIEISSSTAQLKTSSVGSFLFGRFDSTCAEAAPVAQLGLIVNLEYTATTSGGGATCTSKISGNESPPSMPKFTVESNTYSILLDDIKILAGGTITCNGRTSEVPRQPWPIFQCREPIAGVALPAVGTTLQGNYSDTIACGSAGGTVSADRNVSWKIEPSDTEPPPPEVQTVDDACVVAGSAIAVENQSLGEAVDIVGTPFQLDYQSDRVPGRKDAAWDARSVGLGGWTLDVHHAYDPASNTLHLGDGTTRSSASLGAATRVGSEYIIAAEDGG